MAVPKDRFSSVEAALNLARNAGTQGERDKAKAWLKQEYPKRTIPEWIHAGTSRDTGAAAGADADADDGGDADPFTEKLKSDIRAEAYLRGAEDFEVRNILSLLISRGAAAGRRYLEGKEDKIIYRWITDRPKDTVEVVGGIKERELAHKITTDAANQAYLRSRLNFDTEADARSAALAAASQEIERIRGARRFGLDLGEFLTTLRGPQNYAQYFNVLSQRPGQPLGTGVSERMTSVLGGLGQIAANPNFMVPQGVELGFNKVLQSLFSGTPVPGAPGGPAVPGAQLPQFNVGQVSPQQYARLVPSEQEAVVSIAEARGVPREDFLAALKRSLPGAIQVASPRLGATALRI